MDTIMLPGQFTGTFLKNHGLPAADKWYEHEPERVVEKSDIRQSSCGISQCRQIMKYKVEGQILFSYVTKKTSALLLILLCLEMPVQLKKRKKRLKRSHDQDLKREMTRLWNTKAHAVPVVVDVLGMIPKNLKQHLGTGRLLRKVLEA